MVISGDVHRSRPQTPASVTITHPNREKAIVQGTRATVILLHARHRGADAAHHHRRLGSPRGRPPSRSQLVFIVVYLLLAFYAGRWNRGVLPVASALAVLLIIFALTRRLRAGSTATAPASTSPLLNAGLLGLLTLLLVPVQILLITFAMRGFQQGWNVELEQRAPAPAGTTATTLHPA